MRRYLIAWLAGLVAFVGLSTAGALEWTQQRPVQAMEVVTVPGSDPATYYFYNEDGWGAPGCPGAVWAYILSTRNGSRELLAVVMQANQLGRVVSFQGECVSGYFVITLLYLAPQ